MEKKSLITLVSEANQIVEQLIQLDGELTPEINALLEVNQTDLVTKIDSYDFVMDRLDAEAKFYKERAMFYQNITRTLLNAQDRIKQSIKSAMICLDKTEISGSDFKFKLSKTKPSLILSELLLDDSYKREIISYEIQKDLIREDLKNGIDVIGARLEDSFALRKYANKKG